MKEHFREGSTHYHPDQEVEVGAKVGAYLIEHNKAVEVKRQPAAGSIHDVEPQFENANQPPKVEKPEKVSRRGKAKSK